MSYCLPNLYYNQHIVGIAYTTQTHADIRSVAFARQHLSRDVCAIGANKLLTSGGREYICDKKKRVTYIHAMSREGFYLFRLQAGELLAFVEVVPALSLSLWSNVFKSAAWALREIVSKLSTYHDFIWLCRAWFLLIFNIMFETNEEKKYFLVSRKAHDLKHPSIYEKSSSS